MTQDAVAEMLANWRKMSDEVMSAWGRAMTDGTKSEAGVSAMQEMERAYLGMRTMMGQAAKNAYEPLVSAAGAVPLSEFQRLADQVHTILLRLDRIDDALAELRGIRTRSTAPGPAAAAPAETRAVAAEASSAAPSRKAKKRDKKR